MGSYLGIRYTRATERASDGTTGAGPAQVLRRSITQKKFSRESTVERAPGVVMHHAFEVVEHIAERGFYCVHKKSSAKSHRNFSVNQMHHVTSDTYIADAVVRA